jgi:hypothetical protein
VLWILTWTQLRLSSSVGFFERLKGGWPPSQKLATRHRMAWFGAAKARGPGGRPACRGKGRFGTDRFGRARCRAWRRSKLREGSCLTMLCDIRFTMVAICFPHPEQRARGFLLLARVGTVRTLRGEIYVCSEKALEVLDSHKIPYTRLPSPVNQDDAKG